MLIELVAQSFCHVCFSVDFKICLNYTVYMSGSQSSVKKEPRDEKTKVLHICENKDPYQLRGYREADQRVLF